MRCLILVSGYVQIRMILALIIYGILKVSLGRHRYMSKDMFRDIVNEGNHGNGERREGRELGKT